MNLKIEQTEVLIVSFNVHVMTSDGLVGVIEARSSVGSWRSALAPCPLEVATWIVLVVANIAGFKIAELGRRAGRIQHSHIVQGHVANENVGHVSLSNYYDIC